MQVQRLAQRRNTGPDEKITGNDSLPSNVSSRRFETAQLGAAERGPGMPEIDSTTGSWSEWLGWAFDVIDEDPDIRVRAHERLKAAGQRRSQALAAFNPP